MDLESPPTIASDEQRQLDRLRSELLSEFGERLSPSVVDTRFDAIVAEFEQAAVRTYIPVLARRRFRQLVAGQH